MGVYKRLFLPRQNNATIASGWVGWFPSLPNQLFCLCGVLPSFCMSSLRHPRHQGTPSANEEGQRGRRRSPPPKNTVPSGPLPSEEWLLERAKKRASLPLAPYWRDLMWPVLPPDHVPLFKQKEGKSLERALKSLKESTTHRSASPWWSEEQQREEEEQHNTLKGKQMFERQEPMTRKKRPRPVTAAEVMTEKEIQAQRQRRAQDEAAFMANLREKVARRGEGERGEALGDGALYKKGTTTKKSEWQE